MPHPRKRPAAKKMRMEWPGRASLGMTATTTKSGGLRVRAGVRAGTLATANHNRSVQRLR